MRRSCCGQQSSFNPPLLSNRPLLPKRARLDEHPTPRRPLSSSSEESVSQFYGVGDEAALENLFAAYPQRFSSVPQPQGSRGLCEPAWKLRPDYRLYLRNEFSPDRIRWNRVRALIPGAKIDPPSIYPSLPAEPPTTSTNVAFESALRLVRQVIGEDQPLTADVARSFEHVREWQQGLGWSPLDSDEYESPPPYSPPLHPHRQNKRSSRRIFTILAICGALYLTRARHNT